MSKHLNHHQNSIRQVGRIITLMLLLTFFCVGTVSNSNAQTANKASAPAAAKQETDASKEGGPKEGIKVHGYWTIDVRNPDGTLVMHREFENALLTSGADMLRQFLLREATPGLWAIGLHATVGNQPCPIGQNQTGCFIEEPLYAFNQINLFKNLTVSYANGGLTLSGTATAGADSAINQVTTMIAPCSKTLAPGALDSSCLGTLQNSFTEKTVSPAISVSAGQIIQVKVVISFS